MKYPILKLAEVDLKNFSEHWSKVYTDPLADIYENRIKAKRFTADDIIQLFTWKNGGKLSKRKLASVKAITNKLDIINKLKQKMDIELFEANFKKMTAIWKIFLCHIIAPTTYPIFDQHAFRAYHYLKHGTVNELEDNDKVKNIVYAEYTLYFHELQKEGINYKQIDEALWAFGKFLKTPYADAIL